MRVFILTLVCLLAILVTREVLEVQAAASPEDTVWSGFYESIPDPTSPISEGGAELRQIKYAVRNRMFPSMEFGTISSALDNGRMVEGSARGFYELLAPSGYKRSNYSNTGAATVTTLLSGEWYSDTDGDNDTAKTLVPRDHSTTNGDGDDGTLLVHSGSAWVHTTIERTGDAIEAIDDVSATTGLDISVTGGSTLCGSDSTEHIRWDGNDELAGATATIPANSGRWMVEVEVSTQLVIGSNGTATNAQNAVVACLSIMAGVCGTLPSGATVCTNERMFPMLVEAFVEEGAGEDNWQKFHVSGYRVDMWDAEDAAYTIRYGLLFAPAVSSGTVDAGYGNASVTAYMDRVIVDRGDDPRIIVHQVKVGG